jgi:hypothetical protein
MNEFDILCQRQPNVHAERDAISTAKLHVRTLPAAAAVATATTSASSFRHDANSTFAVPYF